MRQHYFGILTIAGFITTALFSLSWADSIYTKPLENKPKVASITNLSENNLPESKLSQSKLSSGRAKSSIKAVKNGSSTPSIYVNRQPFFPFGFYHISPESELQTKRLQDLRVIAAAGFNTMHVGVNLNTASATFLDEAAKLGVYTINEFNPRDAVNVINAYKNKPAVIGWNVADDCNNGRRSPAQILQFNDQVRAIDPQHFTYMSCFDKASRFANLADLFAIQSYPIPDENLSAAGYAIGKAVEAIAPYDQPVIANVQLFAWSGKRSPSRAELRNMTYQAIVNGAKGIIYYTFFDRNWNLAKNPNGLWDEAKSLSPEIKSLSPFFLNGKWTKINSGDYYTLASLWEYDNRSLVIVINTSQTDTRNVNLSLPITVSNATPTFAGRPQGLRVNNGRLEGEVKAKEVHIYNFER